MNWLRFISNTRSTILLSCLKYIAIMISIIWIWNGLQNICLIWDRRQSVCRNCSLYQIVLISGQWIEDLQAGDIRYLVGLCWDAAETTWQLSGNNHDWHNLSSLFQTYWSIKAVFAVFAAKQCLIRSNKYITLLIIGDYLKSRLQ